ncbi:MAG: PRD domain-containing protein [Propionibacteriaceae bacterium]|nr:PRD domain-containing protein [Propionibacteriaceae bacterium]
MRILKVFNNNVVLARDPQRGNVMLTGRGLGFQRQAGDQVEESKIVQVFVPDSQHGVDELQAFLTEIPPEHLALAQEILGLAHRELGLKLSQPQLIPLADHISFAVKRVRQGIRLESPLRAEVTHLYPAELRVALAGVQLVRERTGVPVPDDEAVPIALHLVNAAAFATDDLSRTFAMTEIFHQVFEVLESAYDCRFDTDSVNAARFLTHLRYFFVRVDADRQLSENPTSFANAIRESFPEAHQAAQKVRALLELRLNTVITADEETYLALHIARLTHD